RHLRETVRFSEGVATLVSGPARVLLEVGPRRTLAGLVRQHPSAPAVVCSAADPERGDDAPALLEALGRVWLAGVEVDWAAHRAGEGRRVVLPTYPFQRQRYWIEQRTAPA